MKEFSLKKYFYLLFFLNLQAFAEAPNKSLTSIDELANLSIEDLAQVRIISIATGSKKTIAEAPAIASVVTAKEIETMGAKTLEEVLESIPGIHVSTSTDYRVNYRIRGISTRFNPQVLFMINNIPITSLNGNFDLRKEFVPLKMISRIEIIRGPGSALYGADAVAGVINIMTKKFDDINGTEVGVRGGSFQSHEAWYLHGATYGELNTTLMMDYQETKGHRQIITEDAQTRLDRILGTKASLAPGSVNVSSKGLTLLAEVEKTHWRLRGFLNDITNIGTGQGIGEALDPNGKFSANRATMDLTYHDSKLTKDLDFTSQLAYGNYSQQIEKRLNLFPAGANLGKGVFPDGVSGNPEYWIRKINFDNSGLYSGIENNRLRVGIGYTFTDLYKVQSSRNYDPNNFTPFSDLRNESYTDSKFLPVVSRNSYYSFVQDEFQFQKNWELTSGVRYDYYSDFGHTINPRGALVWKTTPDLTTKILYGEAFRAPNFIDLYTRNNPVTLGNPHLKPETIRVYELGFSYQVQPAWTTGLNFFHYRARNIIIYTKDASGLSSTAQNLGIQVGDGFEVETIFKTSPQLSFTGNYSFVKATDEVSGKPAGGYPGHQIYVGENWMFHKDWNWGVNMNWIGERKRLPTDNRIALSGYTKFDMTLVRTHLFNKCDVSFSIRNLFDADIRDPSEGPASSTGSANIPHDLPKAGRNVDLAVAYKF